MKQRHEAEIVKLEADVESAKFRLQTSGERLQDLKDDLKECTIIAPNDGLVVYASSLGGSGWRRRGDEPPPQVGTEKASMLSPVRSAQRPLAHVTGSEQKRPAGTP